MSHIMVLSDLKPTREDIFDNKRSDKVYVSPQFPTKTQRKDADGNISEEIRPVRYITRIINSSEGHESIKQGQEIVLRLTPGAKQEIVAKIYEDTRGICTLKVAKYNTKTGNLFNGEFTLIGTEIRKLINFIHTITFLPIDTNVKGAQQFTDDFLNTHIITKAQALRLLSQYPELLEEISKGNVSSSDITEMSKRKDSLKIFESMLQNNDVSESDWQKFFEANTWIFGYGLNFVFNAPLEGKKLEQAIAGYSVGGAGKRIDALMARRGVIEATCFVEIKKHNTSLIGTQYRTECFAVSNEVSGGVAQIQKTIQKSLKDISIRLKDKDCNPTGDLLYNFQPKGYLVIGSLNEFSTNNGINEEKYSSFELFRRNLSNPEIITFDELYERAKFIVATSDPALRDVSKIQDKEQQKDEFIDDLPF